MSANKFTCRVCGLRQPIAPWGKDDKTPTFEICDCCGVEFGYEDATPEAISRYRSVWVAKGFEWFNKKRRPKGWSVAEQLACVGCKLEEEKGGNQ